jgi:hypothetical protein
MRGIVADRPLGAGMTLCRIALCLAVVTAVALLSNPLAAAPVDDIPLYDKWPLYLPSPGTPVRIDTPFGKFRIPYGYLTIRGGLIAADGKTSMTYARGDAKRFQDVYTMSGFGFLFWLPDGGVVEHSPLSVNVPVFRPREPGHLNPKGEELVVLVTLMEQASARNISYRLNELRGAMRENAGVFDALTPMKSRWPGHVDSYYGATRGTDDVPVISFALNCNRAFEICDGWMLLDGWDMALAFFMPKDSLPHTFRAARKSLELLRAWRLESP